MQLQCHMKIWKLLYINLSSERTKSYYMPEIWGAQTAYNYINIQSSDPQVKGFHIDWRGQIVYVDLHSSFVTDPTELKKFNLNPHPQQQHFHLVYDHLLWLLHHYTVALENALWTMAASPTAHHHQILTMPASVDLWLMKVQPSTTIKYKMKKTHQLAERLMKC